MVVGFCAKVSKVILFAVNIVFFLTGAGVLGVGLWLRFDKNVENIIKSADNLQELADISNLLVTAAYVLIAFGAIVFVVGFCGCCGAIKESKCLIGIYLAFIVVVLAGELAGGIYAYVNFDKVLDTVTGKIGDTLKKYNVDANTDTIEKPWNFLMIKFGCCGWNSGSDRAPLKDACCYPEKDASSYQYGDKIAGKGVCDAAELLKKTACFDSLKSFLKDNSVIAIAVAGGIAGLEVLVFVLALCFCCNLGKD